MQESASNGCKGCQFFLATIEDYLMSNDSEGFSVFVQEAKPIRIVVDGSGRFLLNSDFMSASKYITVDLCAADQTSFDYPNLDAGPRRPLSPDTNTPEVFELARLWLDCCSRHDSCDAQKDTPLPTRLVELTGDLELPLRLCVTKENWRGKYVSLSHCWGKELPFRTTSDNIDSLIKGFKVELLPQSFRDAVTLTWELGFKYLWIDALCIIQGNLEDWARESAAMTQVYYNATLMISATAATDSSVGIFKPRKCFTSHRFGPNGSLLWQSPAIFPSTSADEEPLDRRAWSYQEKVMAKRILHFRKNEMGWSCLTSAFSESRGTTPVDGPVDDSPSIKRYAHKFLGVKSPDVDLGGLKRDQQGALCQWYNILSGYTHRDLTNPRDKLPALSGLSHGLLIPEFGQYLAGLWEADIFRGLGWTYTNRHKIPVQKYGCYIAPSWSYMAGQGRVHLFDDWIWADAEPALRPSERWEQQYNPRLIDYHFQYDTSDQHGRITNGWIVIRAHCRRILVRQNSTLGDNSRLGDDDDDARLRLDEREGFFEWRFDGPHGYHCPWLLLDREPDGWGEKWANNDKVDDFVAVQIGQHAHLYKAFLDPELASVLLILRPIDHDGEQVYQRVGIVLVPLNKRQKWHRKWQRRDFKII
ncbi:hypothetical protein PFICI_13457 [Pestalotiopsis fici W106-1]|uniref:Heterokaryon incompatibility domain-containing protein n=1 Tax=Pestalotiopsis fici (strain W106-1 / CGMCC3.15140) TaxID=1229662 RepID=W3WM72_PESFW|nr:uncharacterized protein PFICI_13457 [Pestalotiopsis fici W106-1]ETS74973.1 hypothetical protein PFICI_13457 [Pestalotiopsis fici W106-1]